MSSYFARVAVAPLPRVAVAPCRRHGVQLTAGKSRYLDGEAGTVGSMVCVINAVCDALGVRHFEMPATPDRVWAALRGKV
jgi:carbon-monoxide dehydrogenase large subunit